MYKTLRPILDKCVEKWRKPFWTKVPIGDFDRFVLFHHEVAFMWERYSYNDLFSKQSWIIYISISEMMIYRNYKVKKWYSVHDYVTNDKRREDTILYK